MKRNDNISPDELLKSYDQVAHLDDVDWFCDNCNALLNEQRGFTTKKGTWTCRECGTENSIHFFDVFNG